MTSPIFFACRVARRAFTGVNEQHSVIRPDELARGETEFPAKTRLKPIEQISFYLDGYEMVAKLGGPGSGAAEPQLA